MKRKKQAKKITFLGGHRARSRQDRRALRRTNETERRVAGEAKPARGETPPNGSSDQARYPWLATSKPLPGIFYKTIPLHTGGEGKKGADSPNPTPPDTAPDEATPTSNWLGLDYGEGRPAPKPAPRGTTPQGSPSPADDRANEPLRKLDSVVHDFVASLDQTASATPGDRARSAQADRFLQFLEQSPSRNGQVLGPPVFFGASPAVGLESTLGLLGSLRKTGILRVQADDALFMVSIVRGDVVHGVSYPRPESELLGNILVSTGIIDSERLRRFFEACGNSATKIGEALYQQALVSTEELKEALEQQLLLLFDRLLATRDSVWCFHEGEATLAYINMRMNVIGVLLENARKNDERPAA